MFVAVNTIAVPQEHRPRMLEAFRRSSPDLKKFEGFVGFEMWTEESGKLLAVSKWESREAFDKYVQSDAFRSHHGGQSSEQAHGQAQVTYYEGETMA